MNRVGDMGLSIGFFIMFALFGSLNYASVFSIVPFMNETTITIIALLLLSGAMAKSAQIPLHSWLPGSMEGSGYNLLKFNKILIFLIFNFLFFYLIYYLIFNNLFIYFVENNNYYSLEFYLMSTLPIILNRDGKGRTISIKKPLIALPSNLKEAIVGELLGDGHLRFTKKDKNGKPKLNCNALYAMTLKHYDHAFYLWSNIFSSICTSTPIRPWPNPKTGKIPTQYAFNSRCLPALTELHAQWYVWSEELNKFVRIVPLNIKELLTPLGLAHWIMGDGYWSAGTLYLCTDNFTSKEVDLLINTLDINFNLIAGKNKRIKDNKEICWRIRLSQDSNNIKILKSLVKPHLIKSMLYKIGE